MRYLTGKDVSYYRRLNLAGKDLQIIGEIKSPVDIIIGEIRSPVNVYIYLRLNVAREFMHL